MAILKFKNSAGQWETADTAGAVKCTEQTFSDAQKSQARTNIGLGMLSSSTGEYSVKIDGSYNGVDNEANGKASIALGGGVVSKSDGAMAEGVNTTAGRITQAESADTSVIASIIAPIATELGMAFSTQAEIQTTTYKLGGFAAHAEGINTQALGTGAHAEGSNTQSLANSTHAEGDATIASGEVAHAEGWNTKATGNQSHAEGSSTKAKGNSAHSEGKYTEALGRAAHAEGEYTIASGNLSHAEGGGDEKNGKTEASGWCSHAEGWITKAQGDYSHAEGYHTEAQANASHAAGKGTIANVEGETVVGTYNADVENGLFVVGNGSSDSDRKNAFWVKSDGTTSLHQVIDDKIAVAGGGGSDITVSDRLDDFIYNPNPVTGNAIKEYANEKISREITKGHNENLKQKIYACVPSDKFLDLSNESICNQQLYEGSAENPILTGFYKDDSIYTEVEDGQIVCQE